jgi:hypothetical protein
VLGWRCGDVGGGSCDMACLEDGLEGWILFKMGLKVLGRKTDAKKGSRKDSED